MFTQEANYNGPDTFTYTATDNGTTNGNPDAKTDPGTVSAAVTKANDAPTALADNATVAEDGSTTIDAAANDSPGPANESGQTVHVSHVDSPDRKSVV